jgi:hypothetical protein
MITDFLKHLFPRVVLERNLRFSHTFCLGGECLRSLHRLTLFICNFQKTPEIVSTA